MCNTQTESSLASRDVALLPFFFERFIFWGALHRGLTAPYATGFCCGESLCLPLVDEFALCLGDVGEELKHDVCN